MSVVFGIGHLFNLGNWFAYGKKRNYRRKSIQYIIQCGEIIIVNYPQFVSSCVCRVHCEATSFSRSPNKPLATQACVKPSFETHRWGIYQWKRSGESYREEQKRILLLVPQDCRPGEHITGARGEDVLSLVSLSRSQVTWSPARQTWATTRCQGSI